MQALRPWIPWLVFAAVFMGSLAVAAALYRVENAHHEAHFTQAVTDRMNALEMVGPTYFRPVRHFGAVFQEEVLSARGFNQLAKSLPRMRSPSLLALQWIPRERTASGREVFPVRYSYSLAADERDEPGADPFQRRALEEASQQRHLYLAPWYRVDGKVRLRVLRPIVRKDAGKRDLVGFISGVYQVDRLLNNVLCFNDPDAIKLYVSDPRSEVKEYFHCLGGKVQLVDADSEPLSPGRRLVRAVAIDGEPGEEVRWTAMATADPGSFTASRWVPLVIGLGGLLFGGTLALFLHSLLSREDQIRQLVNLRTQELAERTEQLQAMNSELEQFAYVASHDLKAPLRAVSQLSSWIDEDAAERLDEENRKRLRLMRERVVRMDQLIEGLLAYSRAGRVTGTRNEPVPLEPLLDGLAGELLLPTGFRVEFQKPLPILRADPLHLKQIFQNLITNAAYHHDHPESGKVVIGAEEEEKSWRIEVADDGPGIPPPARESIFGMFASLGRETGQGHTGIGLTIVRKLVHSYGGQVDITDNLPRGSCFRIWWPKSASQT